MSADDVESTKDAADAEVEAESAGGLGELVPEPLMPAWTRVERFQAFRRTHGETYVTILEAIVALLLVVGYAYWLYLYFVAG